LAIDVQTPPTEDVVDEVIELVVTATRTVEDVVNVPRSVTIVNREQLDEQETLTRDLQDILSELVPGLSPPREQFYAPTLRGRNAQVLIDGVPVSGNFSTGFQRSFRTIEPGAIERVEVVRGPSAIYGDGAAGGVVNIITRRPTEEFTASAEVGTDFSLTHPEDSFGYNLQANVAGTEGQYNYAAHIGLTTTGDYFDAEGDLIPLFDNGASNSTTIDVLGKAGVELSEDQSLQFTVNHYNDTQDYSYISDPIVEEIEGLQKARALEVGELEFVGTEGPGNLTTLLNLDYRHEKLLGSELGAQVYYRDIIGRGAFFDRRPFDPDTEFPIERSVQATQRYGTRLQIETPIFETASVLWGTDYSNEEVYEDLDTFDVETFDESGGQVLRKIGDRTSAPEYNVESLGLFAQLQWEATEQVLLSGGIRHERYGIAAPDFTSQQGNFIEGGEQDGSGTVVNAGVVYKVTPEVSVFGTFSQGFSLPDIARLFRRPPEGFNFGEDLDLSRPIEVDNYEIGVRGQWQNLTGSLAAFYNYSDFGTRVVFDDPTQPGRLSRTPQRNYGVEAAVDWQATDTFLVGSTFTYIEGDEEIDDDFTPIGSFDIAPWKWTAYVEHQTTPGWRNRLQFLYVGDRDRAFDEGVDPVAIEGYFVADFISSIQIGDGVLSVGIENLFNNQYIPYTAQWIGGFGDSFRFAARGTTLSVNYRLNF
jgi:iron complex outermembrane receptor protein